MMKRILSLASAALIALSALASCAPFEASVHENVRVTSSDAKDAASWLVGRLEAIPEKVVIGTNAASYGVDVSKLEDAGYIIRSIDGERAIFAKKSAGLDRAVRLYAKSVEGDKPLGDVVYHEGYRIEELTIAGNDISTYAIAVEGSGNYLTRWVSANAASSLSKLFGIACGISPVVGGEAEHKIIFREIEDDSWKEGSYRYYVKDGDLIFEYVDTSGAKFGSLMFLEEECGWENIAYGTDYLNESDLVEIPADLDVRVDPMFDSVELYNISNHFGNTIATKVNNSYYTYPARIPKACHGIMSHRWPDTDAYYDQICYTNEVIYDVVVNNILTYLDAKEKAGQVIGDDITYLDVSQGDNLNYCSCTSCKKVLREENSSAAGAVVRWANRLAEDITEEGYGGLKYLIYAYHGSNVPCKTAPSDDVYVTFCTDGHCSRHLLDGSQCQWESFDMCHKLSSDLWSLNNNHYAEWLRGWCELSPNIYVWYYTLCNNFHTYTILQNLYDDFKLMQECGTKALFWQAEPYELGISKVQAMVGMAMNNRPEMTREEFDERLMRTLELEYGDGWAKIMEVLDIWEEAILRVENCWNCWGYGSVCDYNNVDNEFYLENWDRMLGLIESAMDDACSSEQVRALEVLSVSFLYQGCFSAYFPAYESGDTETLKLLEERYALLSDRIGTRDKNGKLHATEKKWVYADLHKTAWNLWVGERAKFFPKGTELKPVPAEYIVIEPPEK